jgi:hypothetical protein
MILEALFAIQMMGAPLPPTAAGHQVSECLVYADIVFGSFQFKTDCSNLYFALRGDWLVIGDYNRTFVMQLPKEPDVFARFQWHWGDFLALVSGEWIDVTEVDTNHI